MQFPVGFFNFLQNFTVGYADTLDGHMPAADPIDKTLNRSTFTSDDAFPVCI